MTDIDKLMEKVKLADWNTGVCAPNMWAAICKAQAIQMIDDDWRPAKELPSIEWLRERIHSARFEWKDKKLKTQDNKDMYTHIASKIREALKAYYEEQA